MQCGDRRLIPCGTNRSICLVNELQTDFVERNAIVPLRYCLYRSFIPGNEGILNLDSRVIGNLPFAGYPFCLPANNALISEDTYTRGLLKFPCLLRRESCSLRGKHGDRIVNPKGVRQSPEESSWSRASPAIVNGGADIHRLPQKKRLLLIPTDGR